MRKLYSKYYYIVFFTINALLIYAYLFKMKVIPLGWDTQFHLNRIEELYRSIQAGHIFSSTGTYAFSQIGLAINHFYPYLFLYPFSILRGGTYVDPIVAYNICSFLITLVSFFISYYVMRDIFGTKKVAFLFSILYNNGGYLLLQISQRGDIAEYIALIFLPLIFMGYEKLFDYNSKKWLWLSIGMICVGYAHILSTIIFSFFLVCLLVLDHRQINLLIARRLVISAFLAFLVCLPMLLTMIRAKMKVPIIVPIVPDTLINEAIKPSDLIINSVNNMVPNDLLAVNLGFITFIAGIFGLLVYLTKDRLMSRIESVGLLFLLLSTKLFPWFLLQKTPIHIIQFPWRFLGISTFCFSLVIANLIGNKLRDSNSIIVLLYLVSCLVSISYMYQYTHTNGIGFANQKNYTEIATSAVYTDYMPAKTLIGMDKAKVFRSALDVHKHIAVVNGRKVHLKKNQIGSQYNVISYKLNNLQKGKVNKVILPVLNYGRNYSIKGVRVESSVKGETLVSFTPYKSTQIVTIYLK